jgi:hypothetical protein
VVFDISFVSLTWNSEAYVRRCLDSFIARCSIEDLRPEFIIVDNGSRDGSAGIVREYCSRDADGVRLITLDRNRGTTYPRNLALRVARSPVICILDSDTEYVSGSLRRVIDLLAAHPSLGIVAPRLLLPDGSVQHSVKRFPTLLDKLRKVPRILTGRKATRDDFYGSFPFDRCTLVETAIAACWFLRTELIEQIGLLDEGIFYSPEDLDYSARVRNAGKHILYNPELTLLHHTQQISHRRPLSRLSMSHLKGLIRFHHRHGGWFVRRPGEPVSWPAGDEAPNRAAPDQHTAAPS